MRCARTASLLFVFLWVFTTAALAAETAFYYTFEGPEAIDLSAGQTTTYQVEAQIAHTAIDAPGCPQPGFAPSRVCKQGGSLLPPVRLPRRVGVPAGSGDAPDRIPGRTCVLRERESTIRLRAVRQAE